MSIFGKALKATYDLLTFPVAVAKEVATFGELGYIKEKIDNIESDFDEFRDELDNL